MVSGSQNLLRIKSDKLETILESVLGSQSRIRIRSGQPESSPSKGESILEGKKVPNQFPVAGSQKSAHNQLLAAKVCA